MNLAYPPLSPAANAAAHQPTKEAPMIHLTPQTLPTPAPLTMNDVPLRLALDYLRRYTQHVVVTASPEDLTLSFGQICPEQPTAPVVEMFASLTMSRSFAQQLLQLLQQQLQAPVAGVGR